MEVPVPHLCSQFTMINAKDWEEHLSHMKYSTKIEINVCNIYTLFHYYFQNIELNCNPIVVIVSYF